MSSWGNVDQYEDAPLWALMQVNKAPTLANMGPVDSAAVALLFENTDADDFITGQTIGLFNYAAGETQSGKVAHKGWVLKVEGSGGRNARIQYETLVALANNS